jgi:hypothetical protein
MSQGNGTTGIVGDVAANMLGVMEVSDVDTACAKEIVLQMTIQHMKGIQIWFYKQPQAWSAIQELNFSCGLSGELDLEKVRK